MSINQSVTSIVEVHGKTIESVSTIEDQTGIKSLCVRFTDGSTWRIDPLEKDGYVFSSPNVKDEPRLCLAWLVRKHET